MLFQTFELCFCGRDLHSKEGGGGAGDHQGHRDQREPSYQTEGSQGRSGQRRSPQGHR